ncbi:importin subunit beta-like protein [Hapsidospora chrysogenum ATCC 11550]|uniref:Importin subunit beta-like protein n=1 Tax=Hapsidospora chrysogenum (strain ATCC 11550 / CBS 779.69 / DSM 880 / IAM 14645 / JCM 23072 / IMI 49137) TaxID=857340 RepID=A0A086T9N2_HAPC1|nr:importin subunit beta-like protein [Hapsidospora chrysogenum ATCC 11550]
MDKDKLAQLLQGSQVPNTEQVKAVTADLQKNYYSQPESLLLLIEIALTHGDTGVRQLASVQALRLVNRHWANTPRDKRQLARQHLLEGALKESTTTVRHSLARLIAGVVGIDMEEREGDDFLGQLFPLNNSDNVVAREVASYILYSMLEDDPTHFSDHTHELLKLFQSRLEDPDSKEVRLNIVRAIGAILMIVEPEEDPEAVNYLQGFLPAMVNILKATVEAEDEENYNVVFEVFQSFIAYDSALLGQHLKDLIEFMLGLAGNTNADDDARNQALAFLIQCVRYRRMKIQGMKDVGGQLMVKAMNIVAELDTEDDEELTPARTAISLVDTLASELPPRQVIVPLLEQFPAFATSQDPQFRVAGILALGNAAEGAPEFISTQLEPLLPAIINLLNDSESQVRYASLVGLTHLAEEMAGEMASHHEAIISAVLKNLEAASQGAGDKASIAIIRSACNALDTFGDGVDTKIMAQYGPNLIAPMVKLLDHQDFGVKSSAASAIGAIASSMGDQFEPFFKDTMEALGRFVLGKDSEDALQLRSATCDSMGRIALTVGSETFQPYVMKLMEASEEALGLDNPRLKETSFILWANLSKVYKENFNHFLPGAFKGLFQSLELEEEEIDLPGVDASQLGDGHIVVGGKKVKVKSPDSPEDVTIATGGDDDWDDIDDLDDLGAVTAVALEQEIALDVLGDIISNSCGGAELETYAQQTLEKVTPFAEHTYEGCRKTAISTLWRIYARVFEVWEESAGVKWEAGMPPKPAPPSSITSIGQAVLNSTMSIWTEDSERSVIADINRNIAATLQACGPAILVAKDGFLQEAVSVVASLITRSHPCQQDLGDEDVEQEVDAGSSEYDWSVIDSALDVVIGLAAALGSSFTELLKIFEKPIRKLASSNEDLHRSTAVGALAEITRYTGDAITPYTEAFGETLARRLTDTDPLTKSNAAYAIGLLVLNSSDTSKTMPMYPKIWEKLEPLLSVREMRMTDNVAGALSRMMLKNPDNGFVSEALPAVVNVLPLSEDYDENAPVYENIYQLYDHSNPTVQQLTPQLVSVFEKVMGPPEEQLEPETRELLKRTVQGLYKQQPNLFSNSAGLLSLAGVQ